VAVLARGAAAAVPDAGLRKREKERKSVSDFVSSSSRFCPAAALDHELRLDQLTPLSSLF
jgi:hypothetical protein